MLQQTWQITRDAYGDPLVDAATGLEIRTLVSEVNTPDPPPDPMQAVEDLIRNTPGAIEKITALLS